MRRWGLLVLVLFCVPALGAEATPPTPAYKMDAELSGPPAVGEARDLTVTILARRPLEASLRLDAPHWVRVDGGAWNASIPEGGRASHTWRVVAERAGFWHASLSFPPDNATYHEPAHWSAERVVLPRCCLYARSDADDGAWSHGSPRAVIPPARVTHDLDARALDAERVEVEFAAAPNASWMRNARLGLNLGALGGDTTTFAAGEAGAVTRTLGLASGNGTVLAMSISAIVFFDAAYEDGRSGPAADVHVYCRSVLIVREGDAVRRGDSWGCMALDHRPRSLPAPAAPALVLLIALVARGRAACRAPRAGHF